MLQYLKYLASGFVAVDWSCNIAAIYEKTNEDSIIITVICSSELGTHGE